MESNVVSNSPNASLRVDKRKGSSAASSNGAASWRPEKSNAPNVWDGLIVFWGSARGVEEDGMTVPWETGSCGVEIAGNGTGD